MQTKLLILAGFAVAFAAGLVIGAQRTTTTDQKHAAPTTGPSTRPDRRGFLAAELGLTPQQQEQMNQIWSDVAHRGGREREEQRRQLRKEREDAIAALIKTDDRAKYDEVLSSYTQKMEALDAQWRTSFQDAVERTKQLLNPDQRAKYEALLQRNQWDRDGRDRGGDRRGDGPRRWPGSRPTTGQS
jgi:Spy/CpxP family protein refolding chaperone